jgi:hypothetical protein
MAIPLRAEMHKNAVTHFASHPSGFIPEIKKKNRNRDRKVPRW